MAYPPHSSRQTPATLVDPYRSAPPPRGPRQTSGRAITSLVLGIVSIVLCCLPMVGPVCGTLAIVMYAKFNGDYRQSGQQLGGRGMAIGGLVTGIIGVAFGLFWTLYWILWGSLIASLSQLTR
ncbi:MAG: hypothetical protein CSB49_07030 [Proteobacteria bacterium]|nr:MAG: hypothetical protein CSB49_07030 [Pseudomonadota bacterium]